MPSWLNLGNGLALLFAAAAAAAFAATLGTFVIGQHYLIPTFWLLLAMLAGNLARYAMRGAGWAQEIVFWGGALASSTLFMGLFFAKRPKVVLGDAFLPVWGLAFLLMAFLTWSYARRNRIFAGPDA
ncbi:MAG: hypothetical protein V2J24_08370 [Pseudomonadales bacterium]|jgi:hypothetical protein|nr:hypothetical protein [Pseudomonadales bacterium]